MEVRSLRVGEMRSESARSEIREEWILVGFFLFFIFLSLSRSHLVGATSLTQVVRGLPAREGCGQRELFDAFHLPCALSLFRGGGAQLSYGVRRKR